MLKCTASRRGSRLPRAIGAAMFLFAFLPIAHIMAAVQFVKWDKPHGGSRANVAAIDLSARKVLWEARPGKSVNFVAETSAGVAVGTDEGFLVLLDSSSGSVIWKTFLAKGEINRLQSDTENGFFVSSGDERFWLVDHNGKVLMQCLGQCAAK